MGNGTANHVKVTEEPSAELKKYVQMKGFANKAGDVIRTKKGKELHIETSKKRELCLKKNRSGGCCRTNIHWKSKEKIFHL